MSPVLPASHTIDQDTLNAAASPVIDFDLQRFATTVDQATRDKWGALQKITEHKYDTIAIPAGLWTQPLPFWESPSNDLANKNFTQQNQLVPQNVLYLTKGRSIKVYAGAGATDADLDAVITRAIVELKVLNKYLGRCPVHRIGCAGGTFLAGAQVAAASTIGITNGVPMNKPYNEEEPYLLEGNQTIYETLIPPQTNPITLTGIVYVFLDHEGAQYQPIQ